MSAENDSHFKSLWVHRSMLRDSVRCEAYRQALSKFVKPGDVVLDMGAGTGILSLFAAQAGARKVYAVERTSIVELARGLIGANGAEDQVQVIHGEMETVELPESVDIIVSEWMGGYGVDENFLSPLLIARDRWLKPRGKILPECVTAWMAPVWDIELDKDMSFWRSHPYNIDLSLIADATANEIESCEHHIIEDTLLAKPKQMWITDIYTYSIEEARLPFRASLSFTILQEGNCNGIETWFHADFGSGIVLTNAHDGAKTHWERSIFPLTRTIKLEPGEVVSVEFTCEPAGVGHCRNQWSVRVGDGDWEHHRSVG